MDSHRVCSEVVQLVVVRLTIVYKDHGKYAIYSSHLHGLSQGVQRGGTAQVAAYRQIKNHVQRTCKLCNLPMESYSSHLHGLSQVVQRGGTAEGSAIVPQDGQALYRQARQLTVQQQHDLGLMQCGK